MSKCKIDDFGNKRYFNDKGEYHREDGPAYESISRYKAWYINGYRHREGGPAIEYYDGCKEWYINDLLHREDGPAVEYTDGTKFFYYKGKEIKCSSNEEFLKLIKLFPFW